MSFRLHHSMTCFFSPRLLVKCLQVDVCSLAHSICFCTPHGFQPSSRGWTSASSSGQAELLYRPPRLHEHPRQYPAGMVTHQGDYSGGNRSHHLNPRQSSWLKFGPHETEPPPTPTLHTPSHRLLLIQSGCCSNAV